MDMDGRLDSPNGASRGGGDHVNLELVINPTVVARSYRKLVELTEDAITLQEIGTQAFHDWRLQRKAAEAIFVRAVAKAARAIKAEIVALSHERLGGA